MEVELYDDSSARNDGKRRDISGTAKMDALSSSWRDPHVTSKVTYRKERF